MASPLIVSIPHRLGKAEAVRRLKAGIGSVTAEYRQLVSIDEEVWSGDRLALGITAMKQKASGVIDVFEDHVRLELTLPWLLDRLARGAQALIQKKGALLLEKK